MAIAVTSLTSGLSDVDQADYASASISPTAGRSYIAWVQGSRGSSTDPPQPTASGAGLTWTHHTSLLWATDAGNHRRITVFYGTGTPSTGAVTFAYGTTITAAIWDIWEITGANTSAPIVQAATGMSNTIGTAAAATLSAASDSNNRPAAAAGHATAEAATERTNWSELADRQNAAPAQNFETQWRSDTFEVDASATWTTSSKWGIVAIEIAIAPVAASSYQPGVRFGFL